MADYWVVESKDGTGWSVRRAGSERASSVHDTQAQAIRAAHPLIRNSGGGELVVHDRHGAIRQKDTISKTDPYPPPG
ncbi:DUF2188 domain-containing protein [Conexibacter sp. W3-3-2]|uniref:DUF2188 domain-containing protein n=1 Tax=Conexibacter sp. W3-3-2 TaxID=2675227 RepID=UPI0012B72B4F|nr:DUF2188 domain-containing protein [Conexibacter sp. W3-3-2]MTD47518.1 DUF2188 domain-containing protein [Conexibacter sp. W3-3-2]